MLNGQALHGLASAKILELHREGLPVQHLMKFLSLLDQNPSQKSRDQLWRFLEKNGLTILEDGRACGYKSVRMDYLDHHTGTYLNEPGCRPKMPRRNVDDNHQNACSTGFHVGTFNYAYDFHRSSRRIMLVAFNPKHTVSVPINETEKLRVSRYEVLREVEATISNHQALEDYRDRIEDLDDDNEDYPEYGSRGWDGEEDLEDGWIDYSGRAFNESGCNGPEDSTSDEDILDAAEDNSILDAVMAIVYPLHLLQSRYYEARNP